VGPRYIKEIIESKGNQIFSGIGTRYGDRPIKGLKETAYQRTAFLISLVNTANLYKIALCIVLLLVRGESFATDQHGVVEKVAFYGHINWSRGIVYAKGKGDTSNNNARTSRDGACSNKAQDYNSASLFETVKEVRINSSCLVKDLVEQNDMLREQLRGMVKGAQVAKREYLSDGTAEATLAFNMAGGFAQLALPDHIKHVPAIKTIPKGSYEQKKPKKKTSVEPSVYTGLVLDARGLKGLPAMVPKIVSESGEEIYGPAIVSREYAVQQGMSAFETDLKSAQQNPRIMNNPITVRGLRTQGASPCDFVISDADARKIRSASENLLFLKQCRVIIVLD
jgi:hypothetical protein